MYRFTTWISLPSKSGARATADTVGRERRTRVLYKAMKVIARHLPKSELKGFVVRTNKLVALICVQLLVPYWHYILEFKDMSAVQHGVAVRRSYIKSMVSGKDIVSGAMDGASSVKDANVMRSRFLKLLINNTGGVENGKEED